MIQKERIVKEGVEVLINTLDIYSPNLEEICMDIDIGGSFAYSFEWFDNTIGLPEIKSIDWVYFRITSAKDAKKISDTRFIECILDAVEKVALNGLVIEIDAEACFEQTFSTISFIRKKDYLQHSFEALQNQGFNVSSSLKKEYKKLKDIKIDEKYIGKSIYLYKSVPSNRYSHYISMGSLDFYRDEELKRKHSTMKIRTLLEEGYYINIEDYETKTTLAEGNLAAIEEEDKSLLEEIGYIRYFRENEKEKWALVTIYSDNGSP